MKTHRMTAAEFNRSVRQEVARRMWQDTYRQMRIILSAKPQDHSKLCRFNGLLFLAYCVLHYHRNATDPLTISPESKLFAKRLIDEIIRERNGEP